MSPRKILLAICVIGSAAPARAQRSADPIRMIADDYVATRRDQSRRSSARLAANRGFLTRIDALPKTSASDDSSRVLLAVTRATIVTDISLAKCETLTEATLRGGADCYRAMVASYSGIDAPTDSIVALGRKELNRIERTMDTVSRRAFGRPADSVIANLAPDPSFVRREAVDSAIHQMLRRATDASLPVFDTVPQPRVAVRSVPANAGSPAAMYTTAQSPADSATIMVDYEAVSRLPRGALQALILHEGVPGHHLQLTLGNRQPPPHPIFALSPRAAFAEGWALYAEGLADAAGLIDSDTTRLLVLNSRRQRAARLIADAGVHVMGWSRDTTVAFLMRHGMGREQAGNEFTRYGQIPGQAATYTLGYLSFESTRERAKAKAGASFSLKEFHERVLRFGFLPLSAIAATLE